MLAVDLVSIVEASGTTLQKRRNRHVGLCPFHSEKTPSFYVFQDNRFKCFGCGAHGDAIDFIQRLNNCTFREALRILGIKQGPVSSIQREEIQRRKRQRKLIRAFREWEADASTELGLLCRTARHVLSNIKSVKDLEKYGKLYHLLELWDYHLHILIHGDDETKFQLYLTGKYVF